MIEVQFKDEAEMNVWIDKKIAERLGTGLIALGHLESRKSRPWLPFEDEFLVSHYRWHKNEWMAKALGRSTSTVGVRLFHLRKKWGIRPKKALAGKVTTIKH